MDCEELYEKCKNTPKTLTDIKLREFFGRGEMAGVRGRYVIGKSDNILTTCLQNIGNFITGIYLIDQISGVCITEIYFETREKQSVLISTNPKQSCLEAVIGSDLTGPKHNLLKHPFPISLLHVNINVKCTVGVPFDSDGHTEFLIEYENFHINKKDRHPESLIYRDHQDKKVVLDNPKSKYGRKVERISLL